MPSKSTLSSRHRRLMIASASSVRRPRVRVSTFSAFHSGPSGLPMPKAGSSRPSESTSIVAHCLASRTGSRNASDTTFMPKRSRRVRPASAAITDMHSRNGWRPISRSVCHSESTPPASQRSTQRQYPEMLANGNSIRPRPMATLTSVSRDGERRPSCRDSAGSRRGCRRELPSSAPSMPAFA